MGKVLVIDDSQSIIHSLRMVLEGAGLEVESACNGVEGLKTLQSGYRPNLIITDINMPLMNGYEFIVHARNLSVHP